MELTRLPKHTHSKTSILIGAAALLLCLFANASAANAKSGTDKNSSTILQRIKDFCKKKYNKKSKKNEGLDGQEMYEFGQIKMSDAPFSQAMPHPVAPIADDKKSEMLLDAYETIKTFYAYDPIGQAWVQIQSFKIVNGTHSDEPLDAAIDSSTYMNFWAYDLSNQTWHKVSLTPYLQQTNTQINSHSPAIVINKSVRPNQNNPLHYVAADALLEELLGVHTLMKLDNPEQKQSIWSNFSLDFSIGSGAIFYRNRLEQMRLLQRQNHDYFFITNTNEVYRPNWFHHTLDKVIGFDQFDHIADGSSQNASFRGIGFGMPITLGLQYVLWQQLLIGLGAEIVVNATNQLVHNDDHITHKTYLIDKKWSTQGRWFAKCGWYAFNNAKHRFFTDIRLCYVHHSGNKFPWLITLGPYLYHTLAYNFGLGYEQQLTDYLSCTVRLAMEQQKFKQFPDQQSYNIHYKQPAIYLQVGLSMRFAKDNPSNHLKNKECHGKNHELDSISNLEGLQDLLSSD